MIMEIFLKEVKRLESVENFKEWVKHACVAVNTKQIVVLQDIFGHSEVGTLKKLFLQSEKFSDPLFAINKIMGRSYFDDFAQHLCMNKAQKIIDQEVEYYTNDYMEKMKSVHTREERFQDMRKFAFKKICDWKNKAAYLARKNERLELEIKNLQDSVVKEKYRAREYKEKARKYDDLKRLLADS